MNWDLFHKLLSIDSTTGKERAVAQWLLEQLEAPHKQAFEVGDGTLNLLFTWGTPRLVFCSHMDTVPPYIPPIFPKGICLSGMSLRDPSHKWAPPSYPAEGGQNSGEAYALRIEGRGSCDAKGQIFALYTACKELEASGFTDFGLLLLAGEETGSWGAKAFAKTGFQAPYLVVGEPTENKLVSASKGTLSYDLTFTGEPFHSGYPQFGVSAVDLFNQFYNQLKTTDFGTDPVLGQTTWNVGLLHSDNPQNILSPELSCRLYFRTTFVSHQPVQRWMETAGQEALPNAPGSASFPAISVSPRGGDTPAEYWVPEGFASAPVAFGSDAPHLTGFRHKAIVGPGSIRTAHRADEQVTVQELEEAVRLYQQLFRVVASN